MKLKSYEVFIGSILIFISVSFLNINNPNYGLSDLYLLYFSYLPVYEHQFIYQVIVSTLHLFWVIYIFSKYISNEILKNGCYIFTRTAKRELWLLKRYSNLFNKLFFYYIFQFILIYIIAYINDLKFNFSINSLFSILIMFFSTILTNFIIIIFCNTLSLYIKEIYSYIYTISILIINVCLVNYFYINNLHNLIKFLPFSQNMILLQNYYFINRDIFRDYIYKYYPYNSFLLSLFILLLLLLISVKRIKSIEIL